MIVVKEPERYTGLSSEVTVRKFLDALARKLEHTYTFATTSDQGARIEDIFHAVDTNEWGIRDQKVDDETPPTPLPDLFTPSQWETLRYQTECSNFRLFDGGITLTSSGRRYIILPKHLHNKALIKELKDIAVRGGVADSPWRFTVRDERYLYG